MNRKSTHPKTIRELVKEIRAKKQKGFSVIAEAIELLDIQDREDHRQLWAKIELSKTPWFKKLYYKIKAVRHGK